MNRIVPEPLAKLPWRVLLLVVAIGCFGQVVLYSAAGGSLHPWALSQGIRFFVLLAGAIGLSYVPESVWKGGALPTYAILVVSLLAVELLGKVSGGSQRWLDLGFIRLQPSEFMKPAIVLACAKFYDMLPPGETRKFGAVWPAAVLIGVPAALVMLQPDLGTALMICAGGATVMFLAGIPLRLFAGGAIAAAVTIPLAINYALHDYQRNRILIFLDPESDPLGTGYHISQSKIAIGSGGIWGKGFLQGTQSHLDYLPEGRGMGLGRRVPADPRLPARDPLGHRGRPARADPLRQAYRGGTVDDDFLLRRDQPDDGDGLGARRRHPITAGELRQLGADDGAAVPWHPDVYRPPKPQDGGLVTRKSAKSGKRLPD
jgi:rod shape determining protein RodA